MNQSPDRSDTEHPADTEPPADPKQPADTEQPQDQDYQVRKLIRMSGRLAQAFRAIQVKITQRGKRIDGKAPPSSSSIETLVGGQDHPGLDIFYWIRLMTEEDIEQVLEIDRHSFSLAWPSSAYRYELKQNPSSKLWVAEQRTSQGAFPSPVEKVPVILGVVVLWMILDEGHIATIAVHPDYRHRGIGSQLLITAIQEAHLQKAEQVTLEVRANNLIAQKLYQRFGFELVGRRPRYYRDNDEDALIMTVKNINSQYKEWLDQERAKFLAEENMSGGEL
jgi:ribosomal-protein-alanine N-acetyltransferase